MTKRELEAENAALRDALEQAQHRIRELDEIVHHALDAEEEDDDEDAPE